MHCTELDTTEYRKKNGGMGLTTKWKCNKCGRTVQQCEGATGSLCDHLNS